MYFAITIENGKMLSSGINDYINSLNDGKYGLEIKKETRSQQQNRLYWGILEQICKETGNEKDELHNFFKSMFLKRPVLTSLGEYHIIPTTSELDKEEFTLYIDNIVLFCKEQGLNILINEE